MTQHMTRDERGAQIARNDIEAGDKVVVEWSPYAWWTDETDVSGRVRAVVESVGHFGDITLTVEGTDIKLRDYGEGRRYVSGPAAFNPETPDRTDVGTGARYYERSILAEIESEFEGLDE